MMKRIFQNFAGKSVPCSPDPPPPPIDGTDDPSSLTCSSNQEMLRRPLHLQLDTQYAAEESSFSCPATSNMISSRSASLGTSDSSRHDSTLDWIQPDECVATHVPKCDLEMNSKSHTVLLSSSSTNVSSALDYVLAELEEQKRIMINHDSSTTISEHEKLPIQDHSNLEDKSIGILNTTISTGHVDNSNAPSSQWTHEISTDDIPTVDQDQESSSSSALTLNAVHSSTPSLRIESSMLLPEDSLNYIAQMKILEDEKMSLNVVENPILLVEEDPRKESLLYSLHTSSTTTSMSFDFKNDAKSGVCTDWTTTESKIVSRTMPMIAGTAAAAQYHATHTRKSPFMTGPFLSNPMDDGVETTTNSMNSETLVHDMMNIDGLNISHGFSKTTTSTSAVPKRSMGMDILADITSYAAPISVQEEETAQTISRLHANGHDMIPSDFAPVGQSLSIYAAIAAQAGISTCFSPPSSRASFEPTHQTCRMKNDEYSSSIHPTLEHSNVADNILPDSKCTRYVGKIRRFSVDKGCYGDWVYLPYHSLGEASPRRWHDLNIDESIEIPLNKGGRLRIFPNFLAESRRQGLAHAMNTSSLFHQDYNQSDEIHSASSVHVMLSSNHYTNNDEDGDWSDEGKGDDTNHNIAAGYSYHRGNSRRKAISTIPDIEEIASDLAGLYSLPNREWNIGVDAIIYNNRNDHEALCPDCSQGVVLILYTFVVSDHDSQVIFKPKNSVEPLQEDDEEIILFLDQGDAFEMDGPMQTYYQHCFPINKDRSDSTSLLAFRHGESYYTNDDGGIGMNTNTGNHSYDRTSPLSTNSLLNLFGHPRSDVLEGKGIFSRDFLRDARAHMDEQRSVCGNIRDGCYSLVVDKLNQALREEDGLCWIQLTCSRGEGGGALCKSYQRKLPIRVFRSSTLDSIYAPRAKDHESVLSRYDGLYCVRAMWDSTGNETEDYPPADGGLHTFFLIRLQKKPLDVPSEHGLYFNLLSLQELWTQIQKLRGVRSPIKFEIPQPRMKLPPLSRGDVDDCQRSTHVLKKKVRISKKKSAYADRFNTKGLVKGPTTEPIIPGKRKFKAKHDSAKHDDSAQNLPIAALNSANDTSPSHIMDETQLIKICDDRKSSSPVLQADDGSSGTSPEKFSPLELAGLCSDQEKLEVRSDNMPTAKKNQNKSLPLDIREGSRIFVEYKGIPYKASVHRCRLKGEEWHYLVHYDGNKKTNVRWIPRSIIQGVESEGESISKNVESSIQNATYPSEPKAVSDDTPLPKKRGRKRKHVDPIGACGDADSPKDQTVSKEHSRQKGRVFQLNHTASEQPEIPSGVTVKGLKKKLNQDTPTLNSDKSDTSIFSAKHVVGTEVYVEFKGVLYLASILNTRTDGGKSEYFVHYDGFKKTADEWVSEDVVHPMISSYVRRFNAQRKEGQGKRSLKTDPDEPSTEPHFESSHPSKKQKKDHEESTKKLKDAGVSPGVEFLPGSCVFVELENKVYLGKMAKRRKSGDEIEYLVIFDDDSLRTCQRWIPLSMIYEINPRTRRVYESTRNNIGPIDIEPQPDKNDKAFKVSLREDKTTKVKANSESQWRKSTGPTDIEPQPDKNNKASKVLLREDKTTKVKAKSEPQWTKSVSSGVDFLPGSTLFVRSNEGLLHLAKMLKKRGKGNDQEYFVNYEDQKNEEDWVSVHLVYEINPQTKRIFNKQPK